MTGKQWDGRAVRPPRQPWGGRARVVVTIAPIVRYDALPEWRITDDDTTGRPPPHGTARVRRIVLLAVMPNGRPVPAGLPVLDARRRVLAHVGEQGAIVLTREPAKPVGIPLQGGHMGVLRFVLPDAPPASPRYERVPAICVPVRHGRHDWANVRR